MGIFSKWLRQFGRRPKRVRRLVRRIRRARLPGRVVQVAYGHRRNGDMRQTRLANEVVDVPAYEEKALRGERAPHRFCWRGQWYRVIEVASLWQDGRQKTNTTPMMGRLYVNVVTLPVGVFQLYFEGGNKRKDRGRWMLYRKIKMRSV